MSDNRNYQNDDSRYAYETISSFGRPKTLAWSVVAMITGILSLAFALFGWAAAALGIIAVICSAVSRKTLGYFDKMSVVGLVFGIFGLVSGTAVLLAIALAGDDFWKAFLEIFLEGYEDVIPGGNGISDGGSV